MNEKALKVIVDSAKKRITLQLCGFKLSDSFQFRWLQTSMLGKNSKPNDVWSLDDIMIHFVSETGVRSVLLDDSFDSTTLE